VGREGHQSNRGWGGREQNEWQKEQPKGRGGGVFENSWERDIVWEVTERERRGRVKKTF